MKNLIEIAEEVVLNYWREYEGISAEKAVRPDILNDSFPKGVTWYIAEIEATDVGSLYMIYVHDLGPVSQDTWRLSIATDNYLNGFTDNDHTLRIKKLLDRRSFDPRTIMVGHTLNGPFTLIDGNHRAMILHADNNLVGQLCFLGIHQDMLGFDLAGLASFNFKKQGVSTH